MSRPELDEYAPLSASAKTVLRCALEAGRLTGRGLTRVRTVARTVADLLEPGVEEISDEVVATALSMRTMPTTVLGGER